MRPVEFILFGIGAILLALFAIANIYPRIENRVAILAEQRSNHLKGDFLRLSSRWLLVFFILSGAGLGIGSWMITGSYFALFVSAAIPILFSGIAVRRYRRQRSKRIISQLPGLLDTLSGYVKAGHSFPEGLACAIPLLPNGIREEISWLSRLNRLGTPLSEAFLAWENRMPSPELSLVARPMRIALSTGGNIVSLLERTRDVLRARQRQQDKMKSMTAQARLQALVLTMLPPIFLLVLSKMEEGFWDAAISTGTGRLILSAAAILQFFGWLLIRKILAVRI